MIVFYWSVRLASGANNAIRRWTLHIHTRPTMWVVWSSVRRRLQLNGCDDAVTMTAAL